MAFKSATQYGGTPQGGRDFTSEDVILTPKAKESGYRVINTRLKDPKHRTTLRMIPSFDENGNVEEALNPEYEPGARIGTLVGPFTISLEVAEGLGIPHSKTMITSVRGDNAGNPPREAHSPANKVVYAVKWKIREMQKRLELGETRASLKKAGQPVEWLKYTKGNWPFSNLKDPQPRWFVQGLCSEWDGHVFRDKATNLVQAKAKFVLMFSNKLFRTFAGHIGQADDPTKPLSLENNGFGDFLSPEHGRPVRITKAVTRNEKDQEEINYGIRITRDELPIPAQQLCKIWAPWNDLLYIPTIEESIEHLIECLGPDMVDFGLKGSEEYPCNYVDYIPDSIAGASRDIPPTVRVNELTREIVGNSGGAPRPQDTPGYPSDSRSESPTRIAVDLGDDDVDQIPFDTDDAPTEPPKRSRKPTPPPFPTDDDDVDSHGEPKQAKNQPSVVVDFTDDGLSGGGSFEDNLAAMASTQDDDED